MVDEPEDKGEETPADAKPAAKAKAARKPAAKAKAKAKAAGKDGETTAKPAAKAKRAPAKAKAAEAEAGAEKPAAKAPAKAKAAKPAAEETKAAQPKAVQPAKATARPQRRRVVRAHARYVRTSARKARMVCGHLRGKSVAEARAILEFTPREVAGDWRKLLESAVANAEANHELLGDDLIVREAFADEGPTIKRFRPRAMGRATPIRKRTSHLTIALVARPQGQAGKRKG
jgi:ribosomal protein L22